MEKFLETGVKVDQNNPSAVAIASTIKQQRAPIPFSQFMEMSLIGKDGYYAGGKAEIGHRKDFLTSSENSELFGATIGRGLARIWTAMGKPNRFPVIEMGAGEGSLAYSILYWTKEFDPEFYETIDYHIIETHG